MNLNNIYPSKILKIIITSFTSSVLAKFITLDIKLTIIQVKGVTRSIKKNL